ncbi:MAG: HdeD family acid-resistance protein [Rhodoglobus sp.]
MSSPDRTARRTTTTTELLPGLLRAHRGQIMAVAVVGLVLGAIGVLFPGATLLTVAIIFGIYLIASGMNRIMAAFITTGLDATMRWVTGLLGLLIVVAGILCLANPFNALGTLALVIGVGWVLEGLIDLIGGVRGTIRPRWFGWVSGIVSIAAGVAMFVLPAAGLLSLVSIGAILMSAVSVTTLLTLPRRTKNDDEPVSAA